MYYTHTLYVGLYAIEMRCFEKVFALKRRFPRRCTGSRFGGRYLTSRARCTRTGGIRDQSIATCGYSINVSIKFNLYRRRRTVHRSETMCQSRRHIITVCVCVCWTARRTLRHNNIEHHTQTLHTHTRCIPTALLIKR